MPTFSLAKRRASPAPGPRATATALLALCALGAFVAGCNPTVKVEAPDKPIVINLNVKIEQEVRVKIEKDAEDLVNNNPDLF